MSNLVELDHGEIIKILKSRYPSMAYSFFYGSRALGCADYNSDLDIIVVVTDSTSPFREKFREGGVLFDAFVYDEETLNGGLHAARTTGSFVLVDAVSSAIILPSANENALILREVAKRVKVAGYNFTHQSQLRQFISNILDDMETSEAIDERRMLSIELYRTLSETALIYMGQGICSRKHAAKTIRKTDRSFASLLENSLSAAMSGNTKSLIYIAEGLLTKLGGPLREGFVTPIPNPGRVPLPAA